MHPPEPESPGCAPLGYPPPHTREHLCDQVRGRGQLHWIVGVCSADAPINTEPWKGGIRGQAPRCFRQQVPGSEIWFIRKLRIDLKHNHSPRRERSDSLQQLVVGSTDNVDHLHFVLIANQFGVESCQLGAVPTGPAPATTAIACVSG